MGARKCGLLQTAQTLHRRTKHIAFNAVYMGSPAGRGTPLLTGLPCRLPSALPCSLHVVFAAAALVHRPQQMTERSCACFPAGHSLGGALAMLAAFDLAPLFPWGSVEVHTIGAPRPGNAAFAKVRCRLWHRQLHALLCRRVPWGHTMAWQAVWQRCAIGLCPQLAACTTSAQFTGSACIVVRTYTSQTLADGT